MPGEWKGSTDAWGSHRDGYWNDALDLARKQGWKYRTLSSHRVGEVACPTGEHRQKIDSSSRYSETKSKDLIKLVTQKCPHGTGTALALEAARKLLDSAVMLIEHAEEGLDQISATGAADEALARAEQVELLLNTADANFEQLRAKRDALLEEAAAPDAPSAEEVLEWAEQAGQRSAEARRELRTVSSRTLRNPLLAKAQDIDERVEVVRHHPEM